MTLAADMTSQKVPCAHSHLLLYVNFHMWSCHKLHKVGYLSVWETTH